MNPFRASVYMLLGQALVAPAFAAPPAHYTIFDVQGAAGTLSTAMNATSVVTGYYADASGNYHGFVRASDGTITTFDADGAASETQPLAINSKGVIGGYYQITPKQDNGFLRTAGGKIEMISVGGITSGLSGLNDKGVAVGNFTTKKFVIIGYVRAENGGVTDLRDPKAGTKQFDGTYANAINNAGVIIGQYVNQSSVGGFVRDTDGTFTNFNIDGAGGYLGVDPFAITPDGSIVGVWSDASSVNHGFVRDAAGTITTFDAPGAGTGQYQGTWPSSAAGDGAIAGYYIDSNNVNHGFMRLKDGSIKEFDAPGAGNGSYQGTTAAAINDAHVIAGYELDSNNIAHGFLRAP